MLEEAINKYIAAFQEKEYEVIRNKEITTKDPSLLFLNSSMAIFKDSMSKGEYIDKTVCVQDCLRNNNELTSLKYFRMLGVTAASDYLYEAGERLFHFLFEDLGMPKEDLNCVIHKDDADFIEFWKTFGLSENLFLTDENDSQYSTRWVYGEGFPITGKGITLVYNNPNIEKCSESCSIHCNCRKYVQFGNIINVENKNSSYLDFGFGLERLISCFYMNNIYKIPEINEYIEICKNMGYSTTNSYELYNLLRSIHKILSSGVKYGNKREEYVLKAMTRQIVDILYDYAENFCVSEVTPRFYELYNQYNIIYNQGNNSYMDYVINEITKYIHSIEGNLKRVYKFLAEENALDTSTKEKIMHERYGLPNRIIKNLV